MTVLINASNTSGLTFSSDTSGSIAFQSQGSNVATIQPAGFSYPGAVVQVVNFTTTTGFTSSSNVLADTAVTATITPKFATSKILVLVNMSSCGKETGNTYIRVALLRGSTILEYFENIGALTSSTAFNYIGSISTCFLDSPATTNATTYKVQASSGFNTAVIYLGGTAATINASHTMTLMEIAV
jgi:hypothetical protein